MPGIDHEQIYERIEQAEGRIVQSEERIMRLLILFATGFAALAFGAITWGAGERSKQLESNAEAGERYGQAIARQDEIARRLDDITALIRAESQLTREIITRHAANRHAHETNQRED